MNPRNGDRPSHDRPAFPASLPLRGNARAPRRVILASHLVFTGYAHWFPNDPRGTGSSEIRKDELKPLGDILPGRQYPQPPRDELRGFFREGEQRIEHERLWFREPHREIIANAFAGAARQHGYTLWACAVCSNHAHVVARTHRDRSEIIWNHLAIASMLALRGSGLFPSDHPLWSHRPYKVFLYSRSDVVGRIDYVNDNPGKEGLLRQHWSFVQKCPFPREGQA